MADVAVLILNYNGEQHLKRFIPSVVANSEGYDIIVGDNGSTDSSLHYLEESFPEVKIIKLGKNYGYAEGYNQLINQVTHDYLILLNSDVEVTSGWIESLLMELQADERVAVVQPKILSALDKNKFEYAGAAGGYIDRYGYPFCRGRVFNTIEEDNGQYDDKKAVFWASGACFMIRKEAFDELGGFDRDFFAHMEEIDLCWRLQYAGYKIMYSPESKVYHLGGGTLAYNSSGKTYLNFRNSWAMLLKNLPEPKRTRTLVVRWVLDIFSMVYFLAKLEFANSLAVLRAHFYLLQHLKQIKNKTVENKKLRKSVPYILQEPFSVVRKYYLKKEHSYSSLVPD